jgi:predicted ATP-binding protein involved in virulence
MRLLSVSVKNFRLFSNFLITFHPELTVIVAPNGGGKTALLDAIKIAYGPFLSSFPTGKGSAVEDADVRHIKTQAGLGRMEPELPVEILAIDVSGMGWARQRTTLKKRARTTVRLARNLSDYAKKLQLEAPDVTPTDNWPILAYYGTGRLWNQIKLTDKKIFDAGFYSRAAGYQDCMQPASSYKFFMDWFSYVSRADNHQKIRFIEENPTATGEQISNFSGPFSALVRAVRQSVDTVLAPTKWGNLTFSETLGTATVESPDAGVLVVDQMSDGIRNTLALAADLAWRCVQLNAHLGDRAVVETEGVVLIDEVDMHLHPEWQQQVLGSLRRAFPNIQFIVTTHSPQVLTSVHRDSIRMLKIVDDQVDAVTPAHETYAQESRSALEDILDVSSRPPLEINLKLREYLRLVEDGDELVESALALRKELEEVLGGGDQQLQLADMLIARNTAKRSRAKA